MKNMKISVKLLVSFGIILILCIALGGAAIAGTYIMSNIADNYVLISIPVKDEIADIRVNVVDAEESALEATTVMTSSALESIETELKNFNAEISKDLTVFATKVPQFQGRVDTIKGYLEQEKTVREKILVQSRELTFTANERAYEIYVNEYVPLSDKILAEVEVLDYEVDLAVNDRYNDAHATLRNVIIVVAAVIVVNIIAIIFFTSKLTRAIVTPVKEIEKAMKAVNEGRLSDATINYTSKDELGNLSESVRGTVSTLQMLIPDIAHLGKQLGDRNFDIKSSCGEYYVGDYKEILLSLRYIRDNLTITIRQIEQSASQVLAGSQQVSDGAQNLSQGATEQASAIEELAATIADLSEKVNTNAQNAVLANEMSGEAGAGVVESNNSMKELMTAMGEINDTASNIGKIIKTIEDIAFQTNILALNAAVEAARAGAAGKGFAVVADEVRNLAGKSAEAAKNTNDLIGNAIKAIQAGTEQASATATQLDAVVTKAAGVAEKIGEISAASEQQATALAQVETGIEQISAVVQTNSATAEESAAASEELAGQANMLKELTDGFTLMKDGNTSFEAPAVSEPVHEYAPAPVVDSPVESDTFASFADNYDDKY